MHALLFLLLVIAPASAASPAEAFLETIDTVEQALEGDLADADFDAAEARAEAGGELFPDDGTDTEPLPVIEGSETHVAFRVDGVPYLLTDVALTQWFAPYVRDMAEQGIVTGYKDLNGRPTGIFGPERNVSLQELAKMAVGAAGIPVDSCPDEPLNERAKESWSAPYIACAEDLGFAVYADGTADIGRSATRAEVVMTVLQAFGAPQREMTQEEKLFSDVFPSTLFSAAIKTAVQDGIVSGDRDARGILTGTFRPQDPINRAEVSKILSIARQVYR